MKRFFSVRGPKYDMKYFITRSTILSVYRESLQLAYKAPDASMKHEILQMMKDEFRPFKIAREQNKMMSQEDIDYNLAKIRQRIN